MSHGDVDFPRGAIQSNLNRWRPAGKEGGSFLHRQRGLLAELGHHLPGLLDTVMETAVARRPTAKQ